MAVEGKEFMISEFCEELDQKAAKENSETKRKIDEMNKEIKKKNKIKALIIGGIIGIILDLLIANFITSHWIAMLIGLMVGFLLAFRFIKPKLYYFTPFSYVPRGIIQCSSCGTKMKIDDKPRDFTCKCGGEFFVWSEKKDSAKVESAAQRA